ncbi:DUF6600 domain-containing protein [Acidisoma sp. 7E03]
MSELFKWSLLPTVVASAGLLVADLGAVRPAYAQTTPPAPPGAEAPQPAEAGDPPARVGWLSNLSGSVSFHAASQDQWATATQNYPFATGDAVWTQPQAQASIMIDASRIALNGGTELTAQELDQTTLSAELSQGEVFLNLVAMQPGQSVVIATPRGTVQITSNGRYDLYAGDESTPTYVTVVTGAAQFTPLGGNTPQTIGPQQTLVVSGTNPVQTQLGALQQDPFLTSMLQQIAPPPPPTAVAPPPVVSQMTGATVLSQYGSWSSEPQVGTVWFPQVASSWVPYRDGRWAYVQPWGWTWVDNSPWGFAPFHYGRWSQFDGRWGWVPAPAEAEVNYAEYRPVYAPALVTFLGVAAGIATAGAFSSGDIGWAPLGLRDPYYPPYRVPPRYFNAYNRPFVQNYNQFYQRNVTVVNNRVTYRNVQINNINTVNNYGGGPGQGFAQRGATFVPREAMLASRPIQTVARPLPQNARIEAFHPGAPQAALPRPTAATWGVTPAMAQREHLPAAPAGAAPRGPAPGPAIRPEAAHLAPGARPAPPPLVQRAAERPEFHPGPAAHGAPMPGAGQPGAGQPGAARPQALPPLTHGEAAPAPGNRPGEPRGPQPGPAQAPRGEAAGTPAPRPPGSPAPHEQGQQHGPAPQAPRPAFEAHPANAPQAPHPAPQPQAPRPAPLMQAPRAQAPRVEAPRVEAPRQAPQAPRPAPQMQAPRPAPRVEAPRPAPRVEAPRPAPQAPRPAPHPAPQGHGQPENVKPPK